MLQSSLPACLKTPVLRTGGWNTSQIGLSRRSSKRGGNRGERFRPPPLRYGAAASLGRCFERRLVAGVGVAPTEAELMRLA